MKSIVVIVFIFLVGLTSARSLDLADMVIQKDIISSVNNDESSTWKAGVNERFKGYPVKDFLRLLGTHIDPRSNLETLTIISHDDTDDLPDSFDSRKQWPGCAAEIRDQGDCGSCWAFGAVEALSDRFCLNGKNVSISSQEVTSCCSGSDGCYGGFPSAAWDTMSEGVVTEECYPYYYPSCHHPCGTPKPTPECWRNETCKNGDPFSKHTYYAKNVYGIGSDWKDIAKEIMTNGPVEVAFTVYEDFVNYKSGVYQHHSGGALGGHAVKMIGWGVLDGTPYWTVANSWNTAWGDLGFFKILRGHDECGIESGAVAGLPKLS